MFVYSTPPPALPMKGTGVGGGPVWFLQNLIIIFKNLRINNHRRGKIIRWDGAIGLETEKLFGADHAINNALIL